MWNILMIFVIVNFANFWMLVVVLILLSCVVWCSRYEYYFVVGSVVVVCIWNTQKLLLYTYVICYVDFIVCFGFVPTYPILGQESRHLFIYMKKLFRISPQIVDNADNKAKNVLTKMQVYSVLVH
jgi:hypothetical protein